MSASIKFRECFEFGDLIRANGSVYRSSNMHIFIFKIVVSIFFSIIPI